MKKLIALVLVLVALWAYHEATRTDDWVDGKTGKVGNLWELTETPQPTGEVR